MGRILPLFPTSDLRPETPARANVPPVVGHVSGDGAVTATVRATNAAIAHALDRAADALSEREANEHRVAAYRRAADTVRLHDTPLAEMLDAGGLAALDLSLIHI